MKTTQQHLEFTAPRDDNARLANLCGPLDENLRQIEQALDVTLQRRGHRITIRGRGAKLALTALENFYNNAQEPLSVDDIQLALVEVRNRRAIARTATAIGAEDRSTRVSAATRIIRSINPPTAATTTSKNSARSCTRGAPICAAARRCSASI